MSKNDRLPPEIYGTMRIVEHRPNGPVYECRCGTRRTTGRGAARLHAQWCDRAHEPWPEPMQGDQRSVVFKATYPWPPRQLTKTVHIRLSPETIKHAKVIAEGQGFTVSSWIRQLIENEIRP